MTPTLSTTNKRSFTDLQERPFPEVAADALRKASEYRQLIHTVNEYMRGDVSLSQPFTIKGKLAETEDEFSLTVNRSDYSNAKYVHSETPPEQYRGSLYTSIVFGYQKKSGTFDRIGSIPWMVIDTDGKVTQIGIPENCQLLEKYFKEAVFGRETTKSDRDATAKILEKLFRELRNPFSKNGCERLLKQFLFKRDHDPAWEKAGKFAYFDPEKFDLWKFMRKHNFTRDQMYRASLMDLSISGKGQVSFHPKLEACVLIPFFRNIEKTGNLLLDFLNRFKHPFESFRMRIIKGKPGDPKYRGFSLIRSKKEPPDIDDQLYNNHLLDDAQGKDIYLTEGEFKCHVATQKTGFITVGILGITLVSDEILDRLLLCKARSLTIVLDADIGAKAIKRADGVTDSERAAYEIALRLERRANELGLNLSEIPEIKIGKLKKTAVGDKQGLDDNIIPMSDNEAIEAMVKLRRDGKHYSEYAKTVGYEPSGFLNEDLAQIKIARSEVKQTIFKLEQAIKKGLLHDNLSESEQKRIEAVQEALYSLEGTLENAWRTGLWQLYGVTRLNLPNSKIKALKAGSVPHSHKKRIHEEGKSKNITDQFNGDITCIEVYFSDMPIKERTPNSQPIELPYSMRDVLLYFSGIKSTQAIYEDFVNGIEALGLSNFEKAFKSFQDQGDIKEFVTCLIAGFAERQYKSDEYKFVRNINFIQLRDRSIESFCTLDLSIHARWNGNAEAIIFCPIFSSKIDTTEMSGSNRGFYHSIKKLSQEAVDEILAKLPSNPARASVMEGTKIARVRAFLRSPGFELQRMKFDRIVSILTQDEIGRNRAARFYQRIPFPKHYLESVGAVILTPDDFKRLAKYLDKQGLLNQAVQAGFYKVNQNGEIIPSYNTEVEMLPTSTRGIRSVRIAPRSLEDHIEHYDSRPKPFYPLLGARSSAASMDPNNQTFLISNLANAERKTVVVAQNERDALILDAFLPKSKFAVIGLNSDLTPRSQTISAIKRSGCTDVVFLGHSIGVGRYDHLALTEDKSFIFDLFDLERRFKSDRKGEEPKILRYAPTSKDLAEWASINIPDESEEAHKYRLAREFEELVSFDAQAVESLPEKFLGATRREHELIAALARALEEYESYLEDPSEPNEEKRNKFKKCVTALIYTKDKYQKYLAKHNKDSTSEIVTNEEIQEWLKVIYSGQLKKFPLSLDELAEFRNNFPLGVSLRKIRKDLNHQVSDVYIDGFKKALFQMKFISRTDNPIVLMPASLVSEEWRNEVGRHAIEIVSRNAQRMNYLQRLEQLLSIAKKHGIIEPLESGRLLETRHSSLTRATRPSALAMSDGVSNTAGPKYVAAMAIGITLFKLKGEEKPVKFIGHGLNSDAAKHLAAQRAFALLKRKQVILRDGSKVTLGWLWTAKFILPKHKKTEKNPQD